jgi:hypothetical protein
MKGDCPSNGIWFQPITTESNIKSGACGRIELVNLYFSIALIENKYNMLSVPSRLS